jgi:hypothetical protein
MTKQYNTSAGKTAIILDRNCGGNFPVAVKILEGVNHAAELRLYTNELDTYTLPAGLLTFKDKLTESTPWDDFKVDEPVIVWDAATPERKVKRYFAEIGANGKPYCFIDGATSWSRDVNSVLCGWDNCVKASEYK